MSLRLMTVLAALAGLGAALALVLIGSGTGPPGQPSAASATVERRKELAAAPNPPGAPAIPPAPPNARAIPLGPPGASTGPAPAPVAPKPLAERVPRPAPPSEPIPTDTPPPSTGAAAPAEPIPPDTPPPSTGAVASAEPIPRTPPAEEGRKIDLNTASLEELNRLRGGGLIGRAIIRGRPYDSPEALVQRRILTRAMYDRIKDQVEVR